MKSSRTFEINEFFENNFKFDNDQLCIIKQTSLETGISEDIVKKVLRALIYATFKELIISNEDNVTIIFPHFILTNF